MTRLTTKQAVAMSWRGCAALCGLSLMAAGCGSFDKKEAERKLPQVKPELMGDWKTDCAKLGFFDFASRQSKLRFGPVGGVEVETTAYTGGDCKNDGLKMTILGNYEMAGKAGITGTAAENFNITVQEAHLTPQSDKAAEILRKVKYCGHDQWSKDKAVDISARDCAGETVKKGDVIFDVLEKSGDELYLGGALTWFNKVNHTQRPDKLDRDHIFKR